MPVDAHTTKSTRGYWAEHRIASWSPRAAILCVPVATAAAASVAVGLAIERPSSGWGELGWWLMVLAVSAVTVLLVERAARKLLPLAALLRLTLIFPDKAPSRLSVVARTMNMRRLRAWRAELVACSGTHFDPTVVRAFVNLSIGRLHWTVGLAAWLAQLPFLGLIPRAGAKTATLTSGTTAYGTAVTGLAALVVSSMVPGLGGEPVTTASASVDTTAGQEQGPGGPSVSPALSIDSDASRGRVVVDGHDK